MGECVKLEEEESSNSGRREILFRLLLDDMLFRSKHHLVGAFVVRFVTQSQLRNLSGVKIGERGRYDGRRHGLTFTAQRGLSYLVGRFKFKPSGGLSGP
jgi:hypothetical protein